MTKNFVDVWTQIGIRNAISGYWWWGRSRRLKRRLVWNEWGGCQLEKILFNAFWMIYFRVYVRCELFLVILCNLRSYLRRYPKPFPWRDELRTISYCLSMVYKLCDWNKILTSSNNQSINQSFKLYSIFCFILAKQTLVGQDLLIHEFSRPHTTKHHRRQDSSGRVIIPSQRPLSYNIQHSKQKDIHAPYRIRIHSLSRPAAPDPRVMPRGHWDRHSITSE